MLHSGAFQLLEMATQIPRSQLYLVNDGDQPLMWSHPRAFRRVADNFLAGLEKEGGD